MRCDQLCQIARSFLSDQFSFELVELPKPRDPEAISRTLADLDDAIVILLKKAHVTFGPGHADQLRSVARAVAIDHVDAGIDDRALSVADLHIAASEDGLHGMAQVIDRIAPGNRIPLALLPHHADPRIVWRNRREDTDVKIGYFGLIEHAVIPPELDRNWCIPSYGVGDEFLVTLAEMKEVNVHYAVRPKKSVRNSWKPFTKGINAAASGANVLVHRGVDDAISLLGREYPFLIEDATADAISDGIRRLEGSVGGSDWKRGLDAMDMLRERTEPAQIAKTLADILKIVA